MTYLKNYPMVKYGDQYRPNITVRADVISHHKNDSRYYFEYDVKDGDTPEIIADKLYDNVEYAPIILQFNNIINPFEDWYKSTSELHSFILEKYEDPFGVQHYVDTSTGLFCDSTIPKDRLLPITNYEYEQFVNDKKQKIKLPLPEIMRSIAFELNNQFN